MLKEQRQFIENFIGTYKPHSEVTHSEWNDVDEITLFIHDTCGGVFITPYDLTSIYDLYKLRHHLILSDETKPIVTMDGMYHERHRNQRRRLTRRNINSRRRSR